jgi:site-specific recombinase XerD
MGQLKNDMIDFMTIRGYSKSTIKLYTNCIKIIAYHYMRSPLTLSTDDLYNFMLSLKKNKKSDSTIHIYYESIKFFYSMHKMNYIVPQIDFLRRPKRLPQVLNYIEILSILNKCKNTRIKTILYLLYSSGLRLSEVINLNKSDIDFNRKTIFVRNGKNNKDRYTILSIEASKMVREYFLQYNPSSILFYNEQNKNKRISPSCIQRHFKTLTKKAEITKNVHVHTLRHSFATHSLEKGTNIFQIMHLLGHSHIQTTMIYLHMQTNDLSSITSPLDIILPESNKLNENDTLFLQIA